jgi:hypothetical protein
MTNFQELLLARALTKHKKPNYNKRSNKEAHFLTFIIILLGLLFLVFSTSCNKKQKQPSPYHYTINYPTKTDSVYCAERGCGGYIIRRTSDYHTEFLPFGNYRVERFN